MCDWMCNTVNVKNIRKYYVEYCQSQWTLLWIWMMLWMTDISLLRFKLKWIRNNPINDMFLNHTPHTTEKLCSSFVIPLWLRIVRQATCSFEGAPPPNPDKAQRTSSKRTKFIHEGGGTDALRPLGWKWRVPGDFPKCPPLDRFQSHILRHLALSNGPPE